MQQLVMKNIKHPTGNTQGIAGLLRMAVLLMAVLLPFSQLAAQYTLSGKVVSATGRPLELATIRMKQDTITRFSLVTDSLGNFSIKNIAAGTYDWRVSYVNHRTDTRTLQITGDLVLTITLEPAPLLDTVKIVSRKPLIERKADRLIFNVENTLAGQSGDALDVLAVTPGMAVQQDNLSMIGKGAVGVLLNGKMIQLSGLDLVNFIKSIPSNTIERVEVMSNPSAVYSAEGNAGLVNIVLKKIRLNYWAATTRVVYNQAYHATGTSNINFDYKRSKVMLSAGINYVDGSFRATEQPRVTYTDQEWDSRIIRRDFSSDFSAKLLLDVDLSKMVSIGTQVFYVNGKPSNRDHSFTRIRKFTGIPRDSIVQADGNYFGLGRNLATNLNATFKTSKQNDDRIVVDLDGYFSRGEKNRFVTADSYDGQLQLISDTRWDTRNVTNNDFTNYSVNVVVSKTLKQYMLNYGGRYLTSENITFLDARAAYNQNQNVISNNDRFRFTERTLAFFSTVSRKYEKMELEIGLRAENTRTEGYSFSKQQRNTNRYFQLFPSAYGVFYINDKHAVAVNYGRRIERPMYNNLNPFQWYISPNYYAVGNPLLYPAYIHNIELTYGYKDNTELSLYGNFTTNQWAQISYPDPATQLVVDTVQNSYASYTYGVKMTHIITKVKWLQSVNELNIFYADINQYIPSLPQANQGWSSYISTRNTVKLDKHFSLSLNYWYYTPRYRGVFYQTAKSNLSVGAMFRSTNNKLNISVTTNDLLHTSQSDLKATVNGVRQFYDNYYDNRYIRISVQYRFGNVKIQTKQRQVGNEDERNRVGN